MRRGPSLARTNYRGTPLHLLELGAGREGETVELAPGELKALARLTVPTDRPGVRRDPLTRREWYSSEWL